MTHEELSEAVIKRVEELCGMTEVIFDTKGDPVAEIQRGVQQLIAGEVVMVNVRLKNCVVLRFERRKVAFKDLLKEIYGKNK